MEVVVRGDGASEMSESMPVYSAEDTTWRLALQCGLQLSDGILHVLFEAGTVLPAEASAILTTSVEDATEVAVVLACGARIANAASRPLASATASAAAGRGSTQIAVRVRIRRQAVHLRVTVLDPDGSIRRVSTNTVRPRDEKATLPSLFRFERVSSHLAGLALDVERIVWLQHRSGESRGAPTTAPGGDVDPSYTSSRVWPASAALAASLAARPGLVQGKRVLEIGAGCGLVGLAAKKLGAAHVALTDLPENLDLLRRNARSNDAPVDVAPLDWLQPSGDPHFHLLLAADCVFWPHLFEPLLNVVAWFFDGRRDYGPEKNDGRPLALLTVTRRLDRVDAFLRILGDRARQEGWTVRTLPADELPTPLPPQTVFLAVQKTRRHQTPQSTSSECGPALLDHTPT